MIVYKAMRTTLRTWGDGQFEEMDRSDPKTKKLLAEKFGEVAADDVFYQGDIYRDDITDEERHCLRGLHKKGFCVLVVPPEMLYEQSPDAVADLLNDFVEGAVDEISADAQEEEEE